MLVQRLRVCEGYRLKGEGPYHTCVKTVIEQRQQQR
jgi:hypothetical protein